MPSASPSRVDLLGEAADLLRRLSGLHGLLLFHQSGGCCDGSSPMCFPVGDFITSEADVHLADLVVVNTCAFIDAARQESIDTILALDERRRAGARLVVTGCMAERVNLQMPDLSCTALHYWRLESRDCDQAVTKLFTWRRLR